MTSPPLVKKKNLTLDTSGIEPDTSRMLSERDKPTTPCAHGRLPLPFGLDQHNPSFFPMQPLLSMSTDSISYASAIKQVFKGKRQVYAPSSANIKAVYERGRWKVCVGKGSARIWRLAGSYRYE